MRAKEPDINLRCTAKFAGARCMGRSGHSGEHDAEPQRRSANRGQKVGDALKHYGPWVLVLGLMFLWWWHLALLAMPFIVIKACKNRP